jgi:peptidoglycan/LPS O-acetylase OafA/YrhL
VAIDTTRDPGRSHHPRAADGRDGHPRTAHRADIQGLRAVAVILVVAYHTGLPVPGGFIGVDMFFVVSGFVIGAMLLRQLEGSGRISFAEFYTRRMRRLLPALAALLVFVAIASTLFLSPFGRQQATARTGIAASLFSANIQLAATTGGGYFQPAAATNALLHTWSLSVEEQFYFFFPAFLLVAWRLGIRFAPRRPQRVAAGIVASATVASFAISCWATLHPNDHLASLTRFGFYSPVTRAWEFGAGILLALGVPILSRATRRLGVSFGAAGALLIVYGAFAITDTDPFPGLAALLPVVGTAMIIVAGMTTERGINAALGRRPAVWVGDLSYGWYLWHWPLIVFAAALWPGATWILVVVAIGSLVPTWLVHTAIENPIRFNETLVGRRVVALIAICIAVPVAAFLGLLLVNRIELRSHAVATFTPATLPHRYGPGQCNAYSLTTDEPCTWSVDNPHGSIVMIGDSNAGQFAEVAARAANRNGYDLTVVSVGGCPFADIVIETVPGGFNGPDCNRFVRDSLAFLASSHPSLVFLSTSSSSITNTRAGTLTDPTTDEVASTPEALARVWEGGVTRVLAQLADAGVPTVFIHTVPNFGVGGHWWNAETCPAIRIYTESCGRTDSRSSVEQQQRLSRDAEERALTSVPTATSVDFTDQLCSADACSTRRDDTWLYRDGTHLSIDGALTLDHVFSELIAEHASPS